MALFLILAGTAAALATLFVLIKGLVNMAGTTESDLHQGDGPSARQLKSNKLMQQRIIFQAVAILIFAILLFAFSARG
jgi:hypothetical protein